MGICLRGIRLSDRKEEQTMAFIDKTLVCRDCNGQFAFSASEQEFYQQKGLENEPRRCPSCRSARRRANNTRPVRTSSRPAFEAVCADCGASTQVPFQPREDRPVYCNACFAQHKGRREARRL